jgi:hypothetical protein
MAGMLHFPFLDNRPYLFRDLQKKIYLMPADKIWLAANIRAKNP